VGHEDTYAEDVTAVESAKRELLSLATRVAKRLRRQDRVAKSITWKVKYQDFVQITRSLTLPESTDDGRTIYRVCCNLLGKTEAGKRPIRLLGVSASQLNHADETKQLTLFKDSQGIENRKRLNKALDTITDKFGNEAVVQGTLLKPVKRSKS
jgi:DNA polymerase-4